MQPGIFNLLHRMGGGRLYHCWFCRLQFFDVRQRFNGKSREKLIGTPNNSTDRKLAS
jgi:hypothetical protein